MKDYTNIKYRLYSIDILYQDYRVDYIVNIYECTMYGHIFVN